MSSIGDRTHTVVQGALRAAINDHGPITAALLPSATKRVVAALRASIEDGVRLLGDEADMVPRSAARVALDPELQADVAEIARKAAAGEDLGPTMTAAEYRESRRPIREARNAR